MYRLNTHFPLAVDEERILMFLNKANAENCIANALMFLNKANAEKCIANALMLSLT
jgi:hypothetical protein